MATKRDRSGEYQRHKERCIQFNICFKCRKPKETDKWLCDLCLSKAHKIDSKRYDKKKLEKSCRRCGQPNTTKKVYCGTCQQLSRDYRKSQHQINIRNNMCITCGKKQPPIGLYTCDDCSNRATASTLKRYNTNKSNNVCPMCGGELSDRFRCNTCHTNHLKNSIKQWHILRRKVLAHYGNQCMCCGEKTYEFLEIDHINGGGEKHRKEIGSHIVEWAIKNNFPANLRILCANCNRSLGKFGVCSHKEEIKDAVSKTGRSRRKRRLMCLQHYGGKCVNCGEDNWAFLEFDHINNDGSTHRKDAGSLNMVSYLINNNFPSDIQLLCSNCNKAKGLYGKLSNIVK